MNLKTSKDNDQHQNLEYNRIEDINYAEGVRIMRLNKEGRVMEIFDSDEEESEDEDKESEEKKIKSTRNISSTLSALIETHPSSSSNSPCTCRRILKQACLLQELCSA